MVTIAGLVRRVHDVPFNLFSQPLSQDSNATSSQNARPSQSAAPRISKSRSNKTWRQPQPVMSSATFGIAIRVPPPIVGMTARTTFKPPTRTRPQDVMKDKGQKFVQMKDLIRD
ncbi:hypothetical protein LIER_34637 [Lithospermum erythrorhizon]|uniref:Uncharacterized protein n=1 Tax=Lithospermum erythrorhizon TaxID=34254 RepID=A0AAV3S258_LITER